MTETEGNNASLTMKRNLSLRSKVLLLAVLPLLLLAGVIVLAGMQVEREAFGTQRQILEKNLLASKEKELAFLMDLAFSVIEPVMARSDLTETQKQAEVKRLFNEELFFGEDGYFFIYDSQGVNVVHPVKPDFVGKPKLDLQDSAGTYVVQDLLAQAKRGSGLVPYRWTRPSTGEEEYKVGYARMLKPWQWMVGSGLYDVNAEVERNLQQASSSVQHTFHSILWLLACAILVILLLGFLVNLHESRMADRHLRELVHNFIQLQVEERRRFARELHDGINQLMVAAKFRIELALRQIRKGSDEYADSLATALATLDDSIQEVRRISHGLRPDLLDEMGLEAALDSLTGQFRERTGIKVQKKLSLHPATMPDDVAIMLYRVVQEALTNIERHARASEVVIRLRQTAQEAQLDLHDNGAGFDPSHLPPGKGIGLKNMRERVELLGGQIRLESTPGHGTRIHATLPLNIFVRS